MAALLPQYRGEPSQPSEIRVAYTSDDLMCSAVVSVSAAGGEHHTELSDCLPDVGEDSAHR
ncbi:MAG: hypothetical protein AMS20_03060 [Gemmatimonas sp. SG8_28]|nr:MAG: hypothetical protein AMS20_03060 [Gemmatimonas sp. SG8_28]